MRRKIWIITMVTLLVGWGCEEDPGGNGSPTGHTNNNNNNPDNSWLVPRSEVFDGGPGKDGIPSVDDPKFVTVEEADFMNDGDLIVGYVEGEVAKAYPHRILDWHEIVNDVVGNANLSVTYCPLTGTGIGWDRAFNNASTTFGVSGLLYNTNLIPYDRQTDSNWSQIRLDCINGEMLGTEIGTFTLVETSWRTWKKLYPATLVLSTNTGYSRDYSRYPYRNYKTDDSFFLFPFANEDFRIPAKQRVHGIIASGNARVFPFTAFENQVTVILDQFEGEDFVVIGNQEDQFAVSFFRDPGDGAMLSYSPVQGQYPVVMTDEEGNMWDIFGTALSGPRAGTRLKHARSFIGFWFSFAAFYPEVTIYGE
jgi:hypothetical protein